jgi:hypothetical protein
VGAIDAARSDDEDIELIGLLPGNGGGADEAPLGRTDDWPALGR